jgi:hypothetical protein
MDSRWTEDAPENGSIGILSIKMDLFATKDCRLSDGRLANP